MHTPDIVYKLRGDISAVFYDGRIVPRHTDTEHFYEDTTDGEVYGSVTARTGILEKKHLKQWAANQAVNSLMDFLASQSSYEPLELADAARRARDAHNQVLHQASAWGTEAHELVDKYVHMWIAGHKPNTIRELVKDESDEAVSAALAAEKFFNDYTLYPIVSEKKIVSKKHKYGGTLDTLFLIDYKGKLQVLLLDLKTSNQVIGNYQYANQVGAYSQALTEMVGIKPHLHWILQVSKQKPKYDVAVVNNIKDHIKGYNLMNSLSLYVESLEEPLSPLKQKNIIKL